MTVLAVPSSGHPTINRIRAIPSPIDVTEALHDFESFYRREFPRLAGSLRLVCGDQSLAEELAQEAFARALNHWERLERYDRPAGWAYRTGFNLLRRHWQRSKLADIPIDDASIQIAAPTQRDAPIDLVQVLSILPLQQRQAVVLRHVLDYSSDEAAEILEVSTGALRMTLHRAIATLRTKANLELEDEERSDS